MLRTLHDDDAEKLGRPTSVLLAGLGVDPSRLLPFLAAEGPPVTTVPAAGQGPSFDTAPGESTATLRDFTAEPFTRLSGNPAPAAAAPPSGGPRPSLTPFSELDQGELARSLAPFNPDVPTVPGIDRAFTASLPLIRADAAGPSDPTDFLIPSRFDAAPTEAVRPGRRNPDFESFFSDSTAAGSGGLEARLAHAVDRLERISEQLGQSSPSGRGGPSRVFRGRIDG